MQAIHLILICAAALAGAMIGVAGYHWHVRQKVEQLKQRLLRSEEARNSAVERSAQAREQIAQLSKAIADMRKAHQTARSGPRAAVVLTPEERRVVAERAFAAAANGTNDHEPASSSGKVVLFANTQPMEL